ncbi:hypothetical protein HHL16_14160 [Pseudoflavitalea sp. G-6-1-2]|uniref:hypothetical protein n=1 Tax=Pseudoflavitalea sp. G-6-1-2 TaxID=2728841 RepID=UPI00146E3DFB|nr:hypothetical protein [Pseudoflavitalea sp. G-6-1-2]NML22027.1 hypothetical protein [Pseudoflavitalea sp. G-6-1-2]
MNRKVMNLTLITLLSASPVLLNAQTVGQVENTAEKVSNTIGKVGGLFKKKDKKATDSAAPKAGTGNAPAASGSAKLTIRTVNDFAAGDSILFADNFSNTPVGKFPAQWKTNTSGQVVSLDEIPGKWFALSSDGMYIPKIKGGMPKDFTIEFDLIIANNTSSNHQFHLDFEDALNGNFDMYPGNPYVQVRVYGGGSVYVDSKAQNLSSNVSSSTFNEGGKINHIAIRKRGERLEMFIGDEKTLDINKAFEAKRTYSTFKFYADFSNPANYLVSNFKMTVL